MNEVKQLGIKTEHNYVASNSCIKTIHNLTSRSIYILSYLIDVTLTII